MYVRMSVCMYVCIYMYVCMYYVCISVFMYVCLYVCIYGRIFYVNQPTILSMLFTLSSQITCYIPGVRLGAKGGWLL